ncbi:MAG: cytochrome b [Rhodocyclaceae bacterium]
MRRDATAYAPASIALHWAIALILFASFPLGLYMVGLPLSPLKLRLYSYHKWAGVTVFLLLAARIAFRFAHGVPAPLPMPRWQQVLASATHLLLYALLIAVPVTGWLFSSAAGFQTVYFGLLPIPDAIGRDKALAEALRFAHRFLDYTLAAAVAVHLAGVLKHQLIDRDALLARMLPGGGAWPVRRGPDA